MEEVIPSIIMSSRFEFRRCDCACSYCCVIIPGAMTAQPSLDVANSVSDAIAIVPARWPLPLVMPSKKCANRYTEHLGGRRPIRPPLFEVWSAPSSHVAFLSHHDHSGCPLLAAIANRLSPRRPSRTAPQAGAQMFPHQGRSKSRAMRPTGRPRLGRIDSVLPAVSG